MNNIQKLNLSKGSLFIFDDVFPHHYSICTWRGVELHAYLDVFKKSKIYTNLLNSGALGPETKKEIMNSYNCLFPNNKKRVKLLSKNKFYDLIKADLVYTIFLNNIWSNLYNIENFKVPFVFELYPGGGFAIENKESDSKLLQVTNSPWFRGVIVSNKLTYNYLLDKKYCNENQILPVWGSVQDLSSISLENKNKIFFGEHKETFDICFAAFRYSLDGKDKGYHIFIDAAKLLLERSNKFRFHVIGNFDSPFSDSPEIEKYFTFHGIQKNPWFDDFYKNIDVFISPNQPNVLSQGSYDGFPTGSAIDAMVRQTALLATDVLSLNDGHYIDNEDYVLIEPDAMSVQKKVMSLLSNPENISRIANNGARKAKILYSYDKQLIPRIKFINEQLKNSVAWREKQISYSTYNVWQNQLSNDKLIQNISNLNKNLEIDLAAARKSYEEMRNYTAQLDEKNEMLMRDLAAAEISYKNKYEFLNNIINIKQQNLLSAEKKHNEFLEYINENRFKCAFKLLANSKL